MFGAARGARPDLDQVGEAGRDGYAFSRIVVAGHRRISMTDSDLRNLLSQLHTRLEGSPSLDEEDRRLLVIVLGDIGKVLTSSQKPAPDIAGLESLAVKFEADHPALSEGLRRLADTLAKAGI
jgi:hypothetical protein